jgi:hypothetical protein
MEEETTPSLTEALEADGTALVDEIAAVDPALADRVADFVDAAVVAVAELEAPSDAPEAIDG